MVSWHQHCEVQKKFSKEKNKGTSSPCLKWRVWLGLEVPRSASRWVPKWLYKLSFLWRRERGRGRWSFAALSLESGFVVEAMYRYPWWGTRHGNNFFYVSPSSWSSRRQLPFPSKWSEGWCPKFEGDFWRLRGLFHFWCWRSLVGEGAAESEEDTGCSCRW